MLHAWWKTNMDARRSISLLIDVAGWAVVGIGMRPWVRNPWPSPCQGRSGPPGPIGRPRRRCVRVLCQTATVRVGLMHSWHRTNDQNEPTGG
jgi:hypothetical protein